MYKRQSTLVGSNDLIAGQFSSAGTLQSFIRAGGSSTSVAATAGSTSALSVDSNGHAYDAVSASGGGIAFGGATQTFSGTLYGALARLS